MPSRAELQALLEAWKPIAGFEGLYEVSDRGEIRALVWRDRYKTQRRLATPRILKPGIGPYLNISLTVGGKRHTKMVHTLVAEAFVGPRPKGYQCAHENGQRHDNRAVNLAWKTPKENEADKARHGTQLSGSKNPRAILTEESAKEIRDTYQFGLGGALARKFGVSLSVITTVAYNRGWKHVR